MRAFNRARGMDSDQVSEALAPFESIRLEVPSRAEMRDDVMAARAQSKVAEASAELGKQHNAPLVEVFGSYAFNSRQAPQSSDAWSQSWQNDRPTSTIGVRFTTAIAPLRSIDINNGYARERDAADLEFQQRARESAVEWQDLASRFADAKQRLTLATQVEKTQGQKMTHERQRLNRGRTTTYQALLFEQDYALAQLARIQTQAEILDLYTRMKTFGANP